MKRTTVFPLVAAIALTATPAEAFYLHLREARRYINRADRDFASEHPSITDWYVDDCFRLKRTHVNCRNQLAWGNDLCAQRMIVYYQRSSGMIRFRPGRLHCA